MALNPQQTQMAHLIFSMGRQAGLPANRALELVAAAYAESGLNPSIANKKSGASGLFQLLSPGYVQRAQAAGGTTNPQANTAAILPDYLSYWKQHPNAAPGEAGRDVERSGQGADFYASPLALLGGAAAGGTAGGGASQGVSSPALTTGSGTSGPSVALAGGLNLPTLHGNLATAMAEASARVQNGGKADFASTIEPALMAFSDAANHSPETPPPPTPAPAEGGAGGAAAVGTPPALPKGSSKLDSRLVTVAHQYGLKITSGYRSEAKNAAAGGAENSYHLTGHAIDVAPSAKSKAFLNWAFHNPQYFAEVFYDPAGMFIKNGKLYKGQIGGHSDHVHVAVK